VNGYEFGAFNDYVEGQLSYSPDLNAQGLTFGEMPESHRTFHTSSASFHQWWFAHIPRNPGVTNGNLNNWWPHLFDFNRFDGATIDYPVDGFPVAPTDFRPVQGEYGTDLQSPTQWGYWHSENGFSPGAKAANVSVVSAATDPAHVKTGSYAIEVRVESSQYSEFRDVGRNDVFYPVSRNAHWNLPNLKEVRFSIKPELNAALLSGTNPVVRLYKNGGNHIELVPLRNGKYVNLLNGIVAPDAGGWYNFSAALAGDSGWEKNVIGYIDVSLSASERLAAKARVEREILSDLSYVEISIRSTTASQNDPPPLEVFTYYIDDVRLIDGP
jgi:hypothetical protein